MASLKYSFLFILIFIMNGAYSAPFSATECLNYNFDETVSHKVKPFGLLKNVLSVQKNKCVMTVRLEKFKYLKKQWNVDICREPIHIKYGTEAVDVYKREGRCDNATGDFCQSFDKLLKALEDDGLIFAAGEREDLNSVHGKLYCSFLLMKSYLSDGVVYSRSKTYESFGVEAIGTSHRETQVQVEQKVESPVETSVVVEQESDEPK